MRSYNQPKWRREIMASIAAIIQYRNNERKRKQQRIIFSAAGAHQNNGSMAIWQSVISMAAAYEIAESYGEKTAK
jgi:cellobiose-specific phosphotransferase system component IIC